MDLSNPRFGGRGEARKYQTSDFVSNNQFLPQIVTLVHIFFLLAKSCSLSKILELLQIPVHVICYQ